MIKNLPNVNIRQQKSGAMARSAFVLWEEQGAFKHHPTPINMLRILIFPHG
jgi:hypothetical protein